MLSKSSHASTLWFTIRFLIAFFVIDIAYLSVSETVIGKAFVNLCVARPSAFLVNAINPSESVVAFGPALKSVKANLNIGKGCDGMEGVTILSAAIVAVRRRLKYTFLGLLFGSITILLINTIRIAGLYLVLSQNPSYFEILHSFAGPLAIVAMGMSIFWVWLNKLGAIHS